MLKAYAYRTKEDCKIQKVELEFPQSSVEEMADIQDAVEKEFTAPEQHMMQGFLSVEAIRKDTREKIRVFIPDIFFSELNKC